MTNESMPQPTLAQKLSAILAECHTIRKRGLNTHQNYAYVLEGDVAEHIRELMSQQHVLLIPRLTSHTREPIGQKGQILTTIELLMTWIDADTGEEISQPWMGSGADSGDKGLYKALTGATKSFLLRTFLIPSGDDPEADERTDAETGHEVATTYVLNAPPAAQRPSAPRQAPQTGSQGVTVLDVKESTGQGKHGPWTRYAVTFGNGITASTFKDELGRLASWAKAHGARVDYRAVKDGKYTNLEDLTIVESEASTKVPPTTDDDGQDPVPF